MASVKPDAVLTSAVEMARAAAEEIAEPGTVGEHQGAVMEGDRVATHSFACTAAAYPGWHWAVTLSRVPRARKATVSEVHLLPGTGALLSRHGSRMPSASPRATSAPATARPTSRTTRGSRPGGRPRARRTSTRSPSGRLGLGRERVLSAEGRDAAATRWVSGDHGPDSETARKAPKPCSTCGYFVPMAGALRSVFGVCANEWSPADGTVVALGFGCGAHSEVDEEKRSPERIDPPVLDDTREIEFVER